MAFSGNALSGREFEFLRVRHFRLSRPAGSCKAFGVAVRVIAGAVEARLSMVLGQDSNEPGTVYIDAVEFSQANDFFSTKSASSGQVAERLHAKGESSARP